MHFTTVFHKVREAIRKLSKKQSLGSKTETSIAMTSDGRMRTGRKSQGDEEKGCGNKILIFVKFA